jgi:hypothetical protein
MEVEVRLLKLVPKGSSLAELRREATRRNWQISEPNVRLINDGSTTWIDGCRGRGGAMAPVVIAEYGSPFTTSVETIWIFDGNDRLARVCVRKTVDAL